MRTFTIAVTALLLAVALAIVMYQPKPVMADGGQAQYRFVTACDGSFGPLNSSGPSTLTFDQHGVLCTSSTGGGGGGAITAAAGSYASGALVDGASVTQGAKTDTACGSDGGSTCSMMQRLSRIATNITTLNTTAGGPVNSSAAAGADPCFGSLKTNAAISTSTGTTAIVTGVASKKIYICSMLIVAGGTTAVSVNEGSSSTCTTSNQAAIIGVSTTGTVGNGVPLVANAGWSIGSGAGTVGQTATAGNYVCLYQSATAQISGNITYVVQ